MYEKFIEFGSSKKNDGELNEVQIVTKVYFPGEISPCPIGSGYYIAPDFAYCLGFSFEYAGGICDSFQQKSLRKIHKPSQFTYDKLMNSLKSPVLVNEQ